MKVYSITYRKDEWRTMYFSCDNDLDPCNNTGDYHYVSELVQQGAFEPFENWTSGEISSASIDIEHYSDDSEPDLVITRDGVTGYTPPRATVKDDEDTQNPA